MKNQYSVEQKMAISRIGGLVVINAMIFQEILAGIDKRVIPLKKILTESDPLNHFAEHWKFIYKEIDYYPIFHLAREIIIGLTANADMIGVVNKLADTARSIINNRAALRHDLMGRIYHRLLVEAKYLGTYYTSIPSAVILLKLALRPDAWNINWHSLNEISRMRVSDLACGTGTLLMAAADVITDNYIRATIDENESVDINELQKKLAEDVLYGYDVLASALHLTASTLALRAPETTFKQMHLINMPLGGPEHHLGSLDLLVGERAHQPMLDDIFGAFSSIQQVSSTEIIESSSLDPVPVLDLCVMNPPFVRSVGGNLLFGSLPSKERAETQKELKKVVAKVEKSYNGKYANITAGLGSVFVLLADRFLRPGSRLGLVLPKALLSGVAWHETRKLLQRYYRLEYLIVSQDPDRWNFSESTSLSEVLVVAIKKQPDERETDKQVVAVNLWRNPTTAFEALAIAHEILADDAPKLDDQGAHELKLGGQKVGEAVSFPWEDSSPLSLRRSNEWILPCAFAQVDLVRAANNLLQGKFWTPTKSDIFPINLCSLERLGRLGPDRRDIHDGFNLSETPTAYPALWGHDSKTIVTLTQLPNYYLNPLHKAKPGRTLRKVQDLLPLAGKVLIAERMRLNTQAIIACRLDQKVLSNVWWTFRFTNNLQNTDKLEKALTIWLNSTLNIIILLSSREETEGAWVDFKKPILMRLPVLDVVNMGTEQLEKLAQAYDNLSDQPLLPLPFMQNDPVREEIDNIVANVLNLPNFSLLRQMLSREPVICLKRLGKNNYS